MSLILAIDQGTHASRALALDETGRILAGGAVDIGLARPQEGWAEQDAEEVVASVFGAAGQALSVLGGRKAEIRCAGLSSQRASCVCWDRASGRALSPIFSWQDRRAHAWIASLVAAHGDAVHRRTGLYLSPHYGASKLRWALEHLPAVRAARDAGTLAWGPMASFLVFRLSKERSFAAEPQCAARTQLYNLRTRDWDPELLALFGLPPGFLPASVPTIHAWGTLEAAGISVPITAVNGDQSAAVFAFGWPEEDCAYVNIGTSAFVQRALARDPGHVPRQLAGIILADRDATVWMVEGNVNGAGTALEWLEKEQGIAQVTAALPGWLERKGAPPLFLNGIAGLGGPFWKADFVSRFEGEGQPWEKAVAVVESIVFLLQANNDHIAQYLGAPARIRVSGGVSRLDGLCRRLASVSGVPVHRREDPEASARGIAYLAAGRPAGWNTASREEVFAPEPEPALRGRYRRWLERMQEATGVRYL
jgi:glycerol kinase